MAIFEASKRPKIILSKIWSAEKSWIFYIMYSQLHCPGLYISRPKVCNIFFVFKSISTINFWHFSELKTYFSFFSAKPETCNTSPKRSLINQNPNQECIFPFTFEGTNYNKCFDLRIGESFLSNICATEIVGEDNELMAYGVCSEDCDNIGTSQNGEWVNNILIISARSGSFFIQFEFYWVSNCRVQTCVKLYFC